MKHAGKSIAVAAVDLSVATILVEREAISVICLANNLTLAQCHNATASCSRECKEVGAEAFVLMLRRQAAMLSTNM